MASLRVSGFAEESIVDGPGIRFTVFTQGCPHRCPGCHNPGTHDFNGGETADTEEIMERFLEDPLLSGMTFSGGEPFGQPEPLCCLAEKVKETGKDIVIFTGYTLEQLEAMENPSVKKLLGLCDLLVDGPFLENEKDLDLVFRGSRNQRILDLSRYPDVKDVTEDFQQ